MDLTMVVSLMGISIENISIDMEAFPFDHLIFDSLTPKQRSDLEMACGFDSLAIMADPYDPKSNAVIVASQQDAMSFHQEIIGAAIRMEALANSSAIHIN